MPDLAPLAPRTTVLAVRGAAVLAALLAVGAVAVAWSQGVLGELVRTPEVVVAPSYGLAAAGLAATPSARRMVAILLSTSVFASTYTLARAVALAGVESGEAFAGWLTLWSWIPPLALVVGLLPYAVPEGRLPSPRWRPAVLALGAVTAAGVLLAAFAPVAIPDTADVRNPLGVAALDGVLEPAAAALAIAGGALCLLGLVSLGVRYRRASGVERHQVLWFGYAVLLTVVATALAPPWVRAVAVLLIPLALVVAVLRYRLFDIDLLLNRTVVAVVLLAGAALLHAAVAGWVGVLVGDESRAASFAAAVAIALAFNPARLRVQRYADRLLQRDRPVPEVVVYRLDEAVRSAPSPRQAVQDGLDVLRESLGLARVRLEMDTATGAVDLSSGDDAAGGPSHTVAMRHHGEDIGSLHLTPDARRGGLSLQDQRVVEAVTGPLAAAAAAMALTAGLEHSRGRLVSAQEEERRRLRHDLHDGLGPQLAAVTMTVDAARAALMRGDTTRVGELLVSTSEQAAMAVEDVRAVARGLRPAALDELGLAAALQTAGPAVAAAQGSTLRTEVVAESELTGLSAAGEAAAYRIAQEAITNAVRHGRATQVRVRLALDDSVLRVSVQDNGVGFHPSTTMPGVGLTSMKERAAALGGSVEVRSAPGKGTTIVATLPERNGAA
ncbi:sensor histidine kinase [Knoellia sp. CPCC 206435]|uniref:sensor histidine kinase n=1 Tax=Knoellia terrae TaxID=3404797 RepID=UPI003B436F6E